LDVRPSSCRNHNRGNSNSCPNNHFFGKEPHHLKENDGYKEEDQQEDQDHTQEGTMHLSHHIGHNRRILHCGIDSCHVGWHV
jgi:hypothetical protein